MFSATVNGSTSRKCWCTIEMPASSASRGAWKCTCRPSTNISPSSGRYRPVRMFESVLFPAPFSPSKACTSPAAASKSTPSFATTPGNRFVIPRIETAGTGGAPSAPLLSSSVGTGASPRRALALRASDHALDEPVHRVQVLHAEPLALRDAQLPLLVVERASELVERPVLDRVHLLGDRRLRLGGHLGPVRRERREAVLDRPVVEGRLPRPVHRGLDAPQVVRPPVVDRCGQPRLRRERPRVRVITNPR